MPIFEIHSQADATLEEIWHVTAETEEAACALLLGGDHALVDFQAQEAINERNRRVSHVRELRPATRV